MSRIQVTLISYLPVRLVLVCDDDPNAGRIRNRCCERKFERNRYLIFYLTLFWVHELTF